MILQVAISVEPQNMVSMESMMEHLWREIIEKILEMREMREKLKNAGDILEMWESPAQCGRVDSYVDQISKTI